MATVSRVASGKGRVNPEMARKVRQSAAALGVDLERRNKARSIAFVLSNRDLVHPVHARVLQSAEARCRERGWEPLIVPVVYPAHLPWQELKLPQVLAERGLVRGAVLVGSTATNLMSALTHKKVAFSVMGNNVVGEWNSQDCDAVHFDGVEGAAEITAHLIGLGHRDIWMIGDCQLPWFQQTAEGYRRAMGAAGLTPRIGELHSSERQMGYLCTKSILARGEPVSAIFAGSDPAAQGVYQALSEAGLRVPEDVSVAGFNDTEGSILHPPLTTARFFAEQMGANLLELLLNRIHHPELPPQRLVIPMQLVKRESCAAFCAPAGTAVLSTSYRSLGTV
jgi:DNA-binding LacI/PurR family transcriptional regulator